MDEQRKSFRRRKSDRPTEILAAAADEFRTHGYGEARMVGIAARANISHGTLYRYFPDKPTLLRAVFRDVFIDPIAPPGAPPSYLTELPAEDRLPHALGHAVRRLVEDGGLDFMRILLFEADRHPEVIRPIARQVFDQANAALGTLSSTHVLPDPPLALLGPGLMTALTLAATGESDVAVRAEETTRAHARTFLANMG